MQFKECNTCHRNLPDSNEWYDMRIKKGGVWGTIARCKKCTAEARQFHKTVRKINKMLEAHNASV